MCEILREKVSSKLRKIYQNTTAFRFVGTAGYKKYETAVAACAST